MASSARPQAGSSLREFELIRALKQRYGGTDARIVLGMGDDAAVIAPRRGDRCLLTTDLLAEGIHFDRATAAFADIGFRAAAANLSDIAAMGGTPDFLLVSLAIPRHGTLQQVKQLYSGLMAACRPHQVKLIGGDTSASTGGWFVGITLVGSVGAGRILFRSGAKAGDDLYVTGTLGDARAGLGLMQRKGTARASLNAGQRRFLVQRHLRPSARIREGLWLATSGWATSAIDVSDGLSGDLRHVCNESGVGAVLEISALPISSACRQYAVSVKQDPVAFALAGGEDYELLFTVPARQRAPFQQASAKRRFRVTRVGRMTPAKDGLRMALPDGRRRLLPATSYEHFRGSP